MESKPSEAGKLSAPPSEGAGSGGGGGPGRPPPTSQNPATTAASSSPRFPPLPSSSSSSSTSATAISSAQSRGGLALGVPAHHSSRPHQPFTSFGPSRPPTLQHQHQHQFLSSMHRGPDPPPSTSQARLTSPGIQNIGMFGSVGAGHLRPSGAPASQPQRPGQGPIRSTASPSSNPAFNQQPRMASQGMPRPPSSMPPPSRPTAPSSLAQQMQMHGPSSMTPPSASQFRPPQQRPPQMLQQTRPLYHGPVQHLQQTPQNTPFPPQPRPSPFLQQASRVPSGSGMFPLGGELGFANLNAPDSDDKIITKKTVQDLFSQIDPSEKLEPDVEDVLIEIAEDFVESLTTFACTLAKHRKSETLETKDILLHAERNWNITLPGFSGDEIKLYRKQNVNDVHRERLALIKKSMGDHRKTTATALTSSAPQQQRP